MKITTKGRYGLKAVVDLASENKYMSIKTLSERQGISENYLEQIIAILKKAGFVGSARGAQGGYALLKPPGAITVGDVLRSLEGSLLAVDCPDVCGEADCGDCNTKPVWEKIASSLNDVVDSITVEDLVKNG